MIRRHLAGDLGRAPRADKRERYLDNLSDHTARRKGERVEVVVGGDWGGGEITGAAWEGKQQTS